MFNSKEKRLYFAYGSNMLYLRLARRVGTVTHKGTYTLVGYKLDFNCGWWSNTYANINYTGNKNDTVEGVLYELDPFQESILDQYEGFPKNYQKAHFNGRTKRETIFAYVATDYFIVKNMKGKKPYLDYLNILLDGCLENNLIDTYNKLVVYKKENYKLRKNSRHTVNIKPSYR